MTVKELKKTLEDMDDDAIIITRSLDPTKFEKPSASISTSAFRRTAIPTTS